jgi:diguanylate cyclase (GGDEF)-like protein
MTRYRRYHRPLSLLMLDIDYFKSVNDRHGHGVGDDVIVYVAQLCRLQIRDSDMAARIGGEEFAIILPETGLEEAWVVAERLRVAVAERPVPSGGGAVVITVSVGLAEADITMSDPSELIMRADEGLYSAKLGGRNRVAAVRDEAASIRSKMFATSAM